MEQQQQQEEEGDVLHKICQINGCLSFVVESLLKCLGFDTQQKHHCQDPSTTSEDDPVLNSAPPRPLVSSGKPPQMNSGGGFI